MTTSKPKWKDETSYSQGDKARIPSVWTIRLGAFRLSVHRYHGLSGWYVTCEPMFNVRQLESEDAEDAKREALEKFIAVMQISLNEASHE